MKRPVAVASIVIVSVGLCAGLASAQLYRWTDSQGRVQMSDKAPPEGTPGVSIIDPKQHSVDPKAHAAAVKRAEEDRQRLRDLEQKRVQAAAPAASAASAAASGPLAAASKPSGPPGETDCARRQREYRQSQECYAPFRLSNGGLRPEAMEKCGAGAPEPGKCP